ncbi:MAG: MFS transporter [Streptococcaceae bacterium]|jgi:DHA1 family multidrug resistance protein B-like MFS transporter|nr:MFS transporter [Streptococcaceae bacterium]
MKEFRNLHPTIQLRLLMNFLGVLTYSAVGSAMTIYYNKYIGAGITGILLILSSVLVFLVGLYAGHLTDKRGRRPIMLFSTLITTVGGLIASFSNSPWFFNPWTTYIGFLILNFGYGFFNVASSAMIVDLTDENNRKEVYSIQYWVFNLGILIGSALSGLFFRDYLFELLLAISLEELLSFILVYFKIPESFDTKKSPAQRENIFKTYKLVSKDRIFMIYCFASIFIAMIFMQVDYYLPVHLSDSFQTVHLLGFEIYGQRMLSLILITNTLIIVLLMSVTNRITKNWTRTQGVVIGLTLQGGGFILAFIGRDFRIEMSAAVILTIGEMINVPFAQALRADLMDSQRVGTYTGVFNVMQTIGAILCGLMLSGSAFYGNNGEIALMGLIIALGVIPTVFAIRLHEKPRKIS